jgi:hypothetical protein
MLQDFSSYDSANKLAKEGQHRLSQQLNINLVQSPKERHAACDTDGEELAYLLVCATAAHSCWSC